MSAFRPQDRKVHELLSQRPLPHLSTVYKEIFEKILGERVSKAAPKLVEASRRLEYSKKTKRPLLFVLHDGETWSPSALDPVTQRLLGQYVVIKMPIREGPALSQLTGQPPFKSIGTQRPLFVVAHPDCQQIESMSGWNLPNLTHLLALGWTESLERNPRSVGALLQAQSLLRPADPALAERIKNLTIQLRQEMKAAREAKKRGLNKLASR